MNKLTSSHIYKVFIFVLLFAFSSLNSFSQEKEYLTFSLNDLAKAQFGLNVNISIDEKAGLEYSLDKTNWNSLSQVSLNSTSPVIYIKATELKKSFSTSTDNSFHFAMESNYPLNSGVVEISGSLISLLDPNRANNTVYDYCFYGLFEGCDVIASAQNLVLPSGIKSYLYANMFRGCSNLEQAPSLPATALANYCYSSMFEGCSKLEIAPSLPATTLANYCYAHMFEGTNLQSPVNITIANGQSMKEGCFQYMYKDCKNANFTKAATVQRVTPTSVYGLATRCFEGMYQGCSNLTQAPSLPATTLANYCYSSMFEGCSKLEIAPTLPATALANYCYAHMFEGTNLQSPVNITIADNQSMKEGCFQYMYKDCKNANFTKAATVQRVTPTSIYGLATRCFEGMYEGCTSLTTSMTLPAQNHSAYCYSRMYFGCTKLTKVVNFPGNNLNDHSCYAMFENSGLTTAPSLPNTSLGISCYERMFAGTAIEEAPALPASYSNLKQDCYKEMFLGCSSLSSITVKFSAWETDSENAPHPYTENWVEGVATEGTFTGPILLPMKKGDSYMPNWKTTSELFYLAANEDGTEVSFNKNENPTGVIYYYKEGDAVWTMLTGTTKFDLSKDQRVYFRNNNSDDKGAFSSNATDNYTISVLSGTISAGGNIMSLLDNDYTRTSVPNYAFYRLFAACGEKLTNIDNLTLPATSLGTNCYESMFEGCSALTSGVASINLSAADKLNTACFKNMYKGCSSLTTATAIKVAGNENTPAQMKASCYEGMYSGTAITTAPALNATTMAASCYKEMFKNSSLVTAPSFTETAIAMAANCCESMFEGCTSLTTAITSVNLSAADKLNTACFKNMYKGCRSLNTTTTIKVAGNENTLAQMKANCYEGMYSGSSITTAPLLKATTLAEYCYKDMFNGCASMTLPEGFTLPATGLKTSCYEGMFAGTAITAAPELKATTLVADCYKNMFNGCSSLSSITVKFSAWETDSENAPHPYTENWVEGVATEGTFTGPILLPMKKGDSYMPNWKTTSELFYLAANEDRTEVSFNKNGSPTGVIYYYKEGDAVWTQLTATTKFDLSKGQKVYFRNYNSDDKGAFSSNATDNYTISVSSGTISAGGNIMSLLDNDYTRTSVPNYAFYRLFAACGEKLTNIDNLTLPATSLGTNCYESMFEGCSALTSGVASINLSAADKLNTACFRNMYKGCSFLTTTTAIKVAGNENTPAQMKTSCYEGMYSGTAITNAPFLNATTLADYCYKNMFNGCASMTLPDGFVLPATSLKTSCYEGMFAGTAITIAPALDATTMAASCYKEMFSGSSITQAPLLKATTLADNCYKDMFNGCANMTLPEGFALPATGLKPSCYEGMFAGTAITTAPALNATTLVTDCYKNMFNGCSKLSSITVKFTAWETDPVNAPHPYTENWVEGVAEEGTFNGPILLPLKEGESYMPKWNTSSELFYLAAGEDGTEVSFNKNGSPTGTIYYYRQGDAVWTKLTGTTKFNLSKGQKVYFRNNNSDDNGAFSSNATDNYTISVSSGTISAGGNIMSLLDNDYTRTSVPGFAFYRLFADCGAKLTSIDNLTLPATSLGANCYESMFEGCSALTSGVASINLSAADKLNTACFRNMYKGCSSLTTTTAIKVAGNENTPAQMKTSCYEGMYSGTAITQAPLLNATTLADRCYTNMFNGCASMTLPDGFVLAATTLKTSCYEGMFSGAAVTTAPALNATTMAASCYKEMFSGSSITQAPMLNATTLADNCYKDMFNGCSSMTLPDGFALPATGLKTSCYEGMFAGTAITAAPELNATTLVANCYKNMFNGCRQLKKITVAFTAWETDPVNAPHPYTENWVEGVAEEGTFNGPILLPLKEGESYMPKWNTTSTFFYLAANEDGTEVSFNKNGSPTGTIYCYKQGDAVWTKLTATTKFDLSKDQKVYFRNNNSDGNGAFSKDATNNYTISVSKGSISAGGEIMSLLDYKDVKASVPGFAFYRLFADCGAKLTSIENLKFSEKPVSTSSYAFMFDGCTAITKAPLLPATTLGTGSYESMFRGCTALKLRDEFVLNSAKANNSCYKNMFNGCSALTLPSGFALPATTLEASCYEGMFAGTAITKAPALTATTLADRCYTNMFNGCASMTLPDDFVLAAATLKTSCYEGMFAGTAITTASLLNATTLADNCYKDMFKGCASMTLPEGFALPATTLKTSCYEGMFARTAITTAPALNVTTLVANCYKNMFNGCRQLKNITVAFTAWETDPVNAPHPYTENWVEGVAEEGTFNGPILLPLKEGESYMPKWNTTSAFFYLAANEDGTEVSFNKNGSPTGTIYCYKQGDAVWTKLSVTTKFDLSKDQKIYFRNNNSDGNGAFSKDATNNYTISVSKGSISAGGEIMSLLDYKDVKASVPGFAFYRLFADCGAKLTSIENLKFSEKPVSTSSYAFMFDGCTTITKAPSLPSETLGANCYEGMFAGTGLIALPELPAAVLVKACYKNMFKGCTALQDLSAFVLPAENLLESCYEGMFEESGVKNTAQVKAEVLAKYCFKNMYKNTQITAAPALPVTELVDYCYEGMFENCQNLKTASELKSTVLKPGAYSRMYYGCSNLSVAPMLPSKVVAEKCYMDMFHGCTNLTLPSGFVLGGITMAKSCYEGMFQDCQKIKSSPSFSTVESLAESCFRNMFRGCIALSTPCKLNVKSLQNSCYEGMFAGTAITVAPELPATTLKSNCYKLMFEDCKNLQQMVVSFESWGITNDNPAPYTENWVKGVGNQGLFDGPVTLLRFGNHYIPEGWSMQNLPVCFTAQESGAVIKLEKQGTPNAASILCSTNGSDFVAYDFSGDGIILANKGDKAYFTTDVSTSGLLGSAGGYYHFAITGANVVLNGNLLSLVDKTCKLGTIPAYAFRNLFKDNETITDASQLKVSVATTKMSQSSFEGMFMGCSALTKAPSLPATTVAISCYKDMFNGASQLKSAPALPSKSMTASCYEGMFAGTAITAAPKLDAPTLADLCYKDMFNGASRLMTAPALPSVTMKTSCYEGMFAGTAITTAPKLEAPTLAASCYKNMFNGASKLTTAPALPAIAMQASCYEGMFEGTAITTAVPLAIDGDDNLNISCYKNMYKDCTKLKEISRLVVNKNVLPKMKNNCFEGMYQGCTQLVNVPGNLLPATTLASECYKNMFLGCTSLKTVPNLPATTLLSSCYEGMFQGTAIENAPTIAATALASNCFKQMFKDCSQLNHIKVLFADWGTPVYSQNWVEGVASKGTFDGPVSLFHFGISYIPEGWFVPESPLCITAIGAGAKVMLEAIDSPNSAQIQYSTDGNTFGDLPSGGVTLGQVGDRVYLRSSQENGLLSSADGYYHISISGQKVRVSGILTSLIDKTCTRTDMPEYAFRRLFANNALLTEVSDLKLKSATLSTSCYEELFSGCTAIKVTPALPAKTLAASCYKEMFKDCSALVSATELPATSMTANCYEGMFAGTALAEDVQIRIADQNQLANDCFKYMYKGCQNLAVAKPIIVNNGNKPTMKERCCEGMYSGCQNLETAPELSATSLAADCYKEMFMDCQKLNYLKVGFNDWLISKNPAPSPYTTDWVKNVAATGTFDGPVTLFRFGDSYIPTGWDAIQTPLCFIAEENGVKIQLNTQNGLNVASLQYTKDGLEFADYSLGETISLEEEGEKVYFMAKSDKGSLSNASDYYHFSIAEAKARIKGNLLSLIDNTSKKAEAPAYGFRYLFRDNPLLTDISELDMKATKLNTSCFEGIFAGCTSIQVAPLLPATTLAVDCYKEMFMGCSNLHEITVPFLSWGVTPENEAPYTRDWVNGVAAEGTFNGSETLLGFGDHYIPWGWQITKSPLYFLAKSNGVKIRLSADAEPCTDQLQYTTNGNEYDDYVVNSDVITLDEGDVVFFVAKSVLSTLGTSDNSYHFSIEGGEAVVGGNILSLIDPTYKKTEIPAYAFRDLFRGNESLTDISNLKLNPVKMYESGYEGMFDGCTAITSAPQLPASTLAKACYKNMFRGTGLVVAPVLGATTMQESCYEGMFASTSLVEAVEVRIADKNKLAPACFKNMYNACTDLVTAKTLIVNNGDLPTMKDYCFEGMYKGCTALKATPLLPATSIAKACYREMFMGCSLLTEVMESLPATTLKDYCYEGMFEDCTSLTQLPFLAAKTHENSCYRRMYKGCTGIIEVPRNYLMAGMTNYLTSNGAPTDIKASNASCMSMFEGCTSLKKLPAWQLSYDDSCGMYMFKDCWSIREVPSDFFFARGNIGMKNNGKYSSYDAIIQAGGDTLYTHSILEGMFQGCINLTDIKAYLHVRVPGVANFKHMYKDCVSLESVDREMFTGDGKDAEDGTSLQRPNESTYYGMFEGCIKLKVTPNFKFIKRMKPACFKEMFKGCVSLTETPEVWKHPDYLATSCYEGMFEGCTSLTKVADFLPSKNLADSCYARMFKGCSSLQKSPILPATSEDIAKVNSCYKEMFAECENLSNVEVFFNNWYVDDTEPSVSQKNATKDWLRGVAKQGNFICPDGLTKVYDSSHMPFDDGNKWGIAEDGDFLCLTACTDENTIVTLTKNKTPEDIKLWYSYDKSNWYGISSLDACNAGTQLMNSSAKGTTLYLKAYDGKFSKDENNYYSISVGGGSVNVSGNIMSLLDPSLQMNRVPDYAFVNLFNGCLNHIGSIGSLELPALNLGTGCYKQMFYGLSSVTSAPALPALSLTASCYEGMFQNCSSLKKAPYLPAPVLVSSCYKNMFNGCSSLEFISVAFNDWNSSALCTSDWVKNVAKSGTFDCSMDLLQNAIDRKNADYKSIFGQSMIPLDGSNRWIMFYIPTISFDYSTGKLSVSGVDGNLPVYYSSSPITSENKGDRYNGAIDLSDWLHSATKFDSITYYASVTNTTLVNNKVIVQSSCSLTIYRRNTYYGYCVAHNAAELKECMYYSNKVSGEHYPIKVFLPDGIYDLGSDLVEVGDWVSFIGESLDNTIVTSCNPNGTVRLSGSNAYLQDMKLVNTSVSRVAIEDQTCNSVVNIAIGDNNYAKQHDLNILNPGFLHWSPATDPNQVAVSGAIQNGSSVIIDCNKETVFLVRIVGDDFTMTTDKEFSFRLDVQLENLRIRAANDRGGFGPYIQTVSDTDSGEHFELSLNSEGYKSFIYSDVADPSAEGVISCEADGLHVIGALVYKAVFDLSDYTIHLVHLPGDIIPKNTGVVLFGRKGSVVNLYPKEGDYPNPYVGLSGSRYGMEGNTSAENFAPTEGTFFGLSGDTFRKLRVPSGYIKPNTAYFDLSVTTFDASSIRMVFGWDDEEEEEITRISAIQNLEDDDYIFNLQGQRIRQNKGLLIRRGKINMVK